MSTVEEIRRESITMSSGPGSKYRWRQQFVKHNFGGVADSEDLNDRSEASALTAKRSGERLRRLGIGLCLLVIVIAISSLDLAEAANRCRQGFEPKQMTERVCHPRNPGRCMTRRVTKCVKKQLARPFTTARTTTTTTTTTASPEISNAISADSSCRTVYKRSCVEGRDPRCIIKFVEVCEEDDSATPPLPATTSTTTTTESPNFIEAAETEAEAEAIEELEEIIEPLSDDESTCEPEYVKACDETRSPQCEAILVGCDEDQEDEPVNIVTDNGSARSWPQPEPEPATVPLLPRGVPLEDGFKADPWNEVTVPGIDPRTPKEQPHQHCRQVMVQDCTSLGHGRQMCQDVEKTVCDDEVDKTPSAIEEVLVKAPKSKVNEPVCHTSTVKECSSVGRGQTLCKDVDKTFCVEGGRGIEKEDLAAAQETKSPLVNLISRAKILAKPATQTRPRCPPPKRMCTMKKRCSVKNEPTCSLENMEKCGVTIKKVKMQICHSVLNKFCRANPSAIKSEADYEEGGNSKVKCRTRKTLLCNTKYRLDFEAKDKLSCLHVPSVQCNKMQGFNLNDNGISELDNCTQVLRQICRRFPMRESTPVQMTDCKEVEVTQCYLTDEHGFRVRSASSEDDLVLCEDQEDQLCGPQESTELTYDMCMTEQKQTCQPGYSEVCSETGQEECHDVSHNPDGSVCIP